MTYARQLTLELPIDDSVEEEDFLVSQSNSAALEAIRAWPGWPATATILDGPHGSGKTHLARIWAARSNAVYLEPARVWSVTDPVGRLQDRRALVIDNADEVGDEVAMLQLYNVLAARGGHMLLTASRPLAAWGLTLPDLVSRLRTAWIIPIGAPDDGLLAALLVKQCRDRQLKVDPGVMHYILRHMERSFAAAREVVRELDRASLRAQRPVTLPLARAVLAEIGADDERA